MKYEVGEVLYLLARKNNKIVPSRVDAVITVKKIGGEEITHQLSVPGVDRTTLLEKLDVIPFSKISDLRAHMINLLEQKVDSEITAVTTMASEAWPSGEYPTSSELENRKAENLSATGQIEETVLMELPNGATARVHLPKELM